MQLLRDNLTLWTSSDGTDAEGAAPAAGGDAAAAPAAKEEAPASETKAEAETAEESKPAA